MQLFNSRDKKYKSIYGAVECGSQLTFRLLLPFYEDLPVESAFLHIKNEYTQEAHSVAFQKTEMVEADACWWECTYRADTVGLYWYHFSFTHGNTTDFIYRGAYGTGFLKTEPASWQLTVYEKGYRTPDALKGGVFYQIFPDRFYASGKEKAGVPQDRKVLPWGATPAWKPNEQGEVLNNDYAGGDFAGIEEKLPYLKDLGVTILYLNPIFEAHSNHRYNTADYEKVDPLLGTEEDFVSLCNAAHKLGIRIMLDGVFNHTGDDSIYFNRAGRYQTLGAYNSKESPYYSWYRFGNWPDTYESWWGFKTLPDVNETHPDYVDFITGEKGIIAKWLTLGADGWRLDVADELPDEFIQKIHHRTHATKKDSFVLGEVWEDASNKISYSQRRKYLLGQELDSVMNYPFAEAILSFLRFGDAEQFLEKILTVTENYPKPVVDILMNLLGTHDTARILTRLAGESCEGKNRLWQSEHALSPEQYEFGIQLEKIATALQFTLPGIPSIYYGDEVGMQGYKDPFNRGTFPWENQREDLLRWYRSLGKLRKCCPLLKAGQFVPISGASGCVCYARMDGDRPDLSPDADAIVVLANNNSHAITYDLPEELKDVLPLFGAEGKEGRTVPLPPYSCAILGRGTWIK